MNLMEVRRDLFGGALTCRMPSKYHDVSDFRQVPDHQEVFSMLQLDKSIMIELLEFSQDVTDEESARYYFQDLAETNSSKTSNILIERHLTPEETPYLNSLASFKSLIIGEQSISKFDRSDDETKVILIMMVLIRLRQFNTDLLLSMNYPKESLPSSSCIISDIDEDFKLILSSFCISDPSLFGQVIS